MGGNVNISHLIVAIISQYIHVSNHNAIHLTVLYTLNLHTLGISNISIKLRKYSLNKKNFFTNQKKSLLTYNTTISINELPDQ